MEKVIRILLLGLVAGLGWLNYSSLQTMEASKVQLQHLNQEINELRVNVETLNRQVEELKQSSVKGMVEEANDAILSGWEVLIDTVQEEVQRAKKTVEQQRQLPAPNNNEPSVSPSDSDSNDEASMPAKGIEHTQ